MGAKSLGSGVLEGVGGLFLQPVLGAESEGVEGFFKGVGKGITGLAVKPVTGVLDMFSRTFDGISSTSKMMMPSVLAKRKRLPQLVGAPQYHPHMSFMQMVLMRTLSVYEYKQKPFGPKDCLAIAENVVVFRHGQIVLAVDYTPLLSGNSPVFGKAKPRVMWKVNTAAVDTIGIREQDKSVVLTSKAMRTFEALEAGHTASVVYEPGKVTLAVFLPELKLARRLDAFLRKTIPRSGNVLAKLLGRVYFILVT